MAKSFRELRAEAYKRDPGMVARVDQLAELERRRYRSRRWRFVRWLTSKRR